MLGGGDNLSRTQQLCQGCEGSSFPLISLFVKNYFEHSLFSSVFFYFQPSFAIFTQFHAVFPCFSSVVPHTPDISSIT